MIIAHINDTDDVTKGRIIAGGSLTEIAADLSYRIECLKADFGEMQNMTYRECLKRVLELLGQKE
ncbi:MAG: hypothetical protein J6W31_05905 [Clostridia bacterium]|nr:hypothetical protein [Clostridia bacterium]